MIRRWFAGMLERLLMRLRRNDFSERVAIAYIPISLISGGTIQRIRFRQKSSQESRWVN